MSKFITNEEKNYVRNIFDDEYTDPFVKLCKIKMYLSMSKHKKIEQFIWLTICPEPKCSLPKFITAIDKFTRGVNLKSCKYVYEQRGENIQELGKGFHCHLLIMKQAKLAPSQFERHCKSAFKECVGCNKAIHIQYFPKDHPDNFWEEKIDYLHGKKWDKEKDAKIQMDILWREKHSLKSVY